MALVLAFITSYFESTNCIFELQNNPVVVNANGHIAVDGAMPNAVVKKPAQKKATTKLKPKSEEVIDISSDGGEVKKEKPIVNKEKTKQQSLKNKAPTLTSTLTAQSKASCGLNYKPNE
ncbi:G2/mitotic-specific cyclin-2 [Forsythia ovata]|uniref:G2/mitotic-specific cyclin-2 n=1 Tax=Forsythia ovata TaxID=205694 RepID=A0ABD1X1U6_9LAMI